MLEKRQSTAQEVLRQFKQWRRNKRGRQRIPEALWEAAVSLCGEHTVHQISQLLHLNHTAIRDRIAAHKQGEGIQKGAPAFMELDLCACNAQTDIISPVAVAGGCVIELEKPGGAKMKISFKGNCPDIAVLSKAFFGAA